MTSPYYITCFTFTNIHAYIAYARSQLATWVCQLIRLNETTVLYLMIHSVLCFWILPSYANPCHTIYGSNIWLWVWLWRISKLMQNISHTYYRH